MFEEGKKYKLSIIRQETTGNGVAKYNKFPVFIPYGLPSELVEVKITKLKKSFANGEIIKHITSSKDRVKAPCPYYYQCGGCDLMHQSYESSLEFKKKNLIELLYKFAKINSNLIKLNNVVKAEDNFYYRNKVTFHVENNKIGFYREGTNKLVEIEECIIINPIFNIALKVIKKYLKDCNIKTVVMKYGEYTKELMLIFETDKALDLKLIDDLKTKIKVLKSIYISNKNKYKLVYGSEYISEKLLDKRFRITPKSFFQVNTKQIEKLFSNVQKYITKSDVNILDLYCGTGVISILISDQKRKILGVDIVKEAIEAANINKEINECNNIEFVASNVKNVLPVIKKANKNLDVIILDPPRSGIDKDSVNVINDLLPNKIIYVSCNPVTLARDLNSLKENYDVKELTPYDLFPMTHHVECLTLLELKKYWNIHIIKYLIKNLIFSKKLLK